MNDSLQIRVRRASDGATDARRRDETRRAEAERLLLMLTRTRTMAERSHRFGIIGPMGKERGSARVESSKEPSRRATRRISTRAK